jgi:hypothetical protein
VLNAESGISQGNVVDLFKHIEAYHLAVGLYVTLLRNLLPAYGGYECKEPEPGKLTLAFEYAPTASCLDARDLYGNE